MPSAQTLTSQPRYSGVAIALHWLLALMIVAAFGVGTYMADLPLSPARVLAAMNKS